MLMPCLKDNQCARRARPSDAINTIFTVLLISYGIFLQTCDCAYIGLDACTMS